LDPRFRGDDQKQVIAAVMAMPKKINGRWYCYQRPLRLILEVLDPKVILSAV
jgi:hypothetical protein